MLQRREDWEGISRGLTLDSGPWFILRDGGLMQDEERFLIGQLAEQAGVNRETLRY